MQGKKIRNETVLIPVPTELLLEAGIIVNAPLQLYADGNRIVIENIDDTEDFVCDGDCESCPIAEFDCDGDCDTCPCNENCEESEES